MTKFYHFLFALLLPILLFAGNASAEGPQFAFPIGRILYDPTTGKWAPELKVLDNVAAGQTDDALVAAVTGKVIRVVALVAIPGATATTSTFNTKGSGAGVAISGTFDIAARTPFVLPFNPAGWFQTTSGEGLSVTTGAGSTTGYQVVYVTY